MTLTVSVKSTISVTVGTTTNTVTTTGPVENYLLLIGTFESSNGYNTIVTTINKE
mgnify:CR=1 FL=1